ncbi:MAG: hypothetical protein KBT65_13410, partial [Sulfitobacter sp.]|nr:hypothetical protein [Sulfitobacter sp.]
MTHPTLAKPSKELNHHLNSKISFAYEKLMGTSKNCPDVGSAIGLSGKLAGECGDGADGFFR